MTNQPMEVNEALTVASRAQDHAESSRKGHSNLYEYASSMADALHVLAKEVRKLRVLAVGGKGLTHWYWKDVAEANQKEISQLRSLLHAANLREIDFSIETLHYREALEAIIKHYEIIVGLGKSPVSTATVIAREALVFKPTNKKGEA